jgi:hypothetical protein
MTAKRMMHRAVGHVLLAVHRAESPTSDEWNAYVDTAKALSQMIAKPAALTVTEGGAPNTVQRAQINDLLAGRTFPAAIVSKSTFVRGIVTALSWFNPATKAFEPGKFTAACEHAGVLGAQRESLERHIDEMRTELGLARMFSTRSQDRTG